MLKKIANAMQQKRYQIQNDIILLVKIWNITNLGHPHSLCM